MKRVILALAAFAAFVLVWAVGLREAHAMCGGNVFNRCHQLTQVCDNPCTPLPWATRVANLDTPPTIGTSFFAGAIGHCAYRRTRDAILECAWQEVIFRDNFPEVASDPNAAQIKQGLFGSARTRQALDKVTAPPPPPPACGFPFNCTRDRLCQAGCPPIPGQTCQQHVSAFDGQGGFFWNAVGHCNKPGVAATRAGVIACAWDEVLQNSPSFRADEACIKNGLSESASGKQAIDQVVGQIVARDNGAPPPCRVYGCTADRQCDANCTPLPNQTCALHVRAFDGRGAFFWNAVMHCNRAGIVATREAVTECAWAETIKNSPSFANDACIKNGLTTSATGREAIGLVTSQLSSSTELHTATDQELAQCRSKPVHLGGAGAACKSFADWRATATQNCGSQGLTAIDFNLGASCPGEAMFRGVDFACCSKVPKDQNICSDSEMTRMTAEAQFTPDKVQEGLLNFFVSPATVAVGYTAPELIRLVKEIVSEIKHPTCFNRLMGEQAQELGFIMGQKAELFTHSWEADPCGSATRFWTDTLDVLKRNSIVFNRLPIPLRVAAYSTMVATTPLVCGTSYGVWKLKKVAEELIDSRILPFLLTQATDFLLVQDSQERIDAIANKRMNTANVGVEFAGHVQSLAQAMATKNRAAYDQAVAKLRAASDTWYRADDTAVVKMFTGLLKDFREPILSKLQPLGEDMLHGVLDPIYKVGREAGIAGFGEVPYCGGALAASISTLSDLAHMVLIKGTVIAIKMGANQLLGLAIDELEKALLKQTASRDVAKFNIFLQRLMPAFERTKAQLTGLRDNMRSQVNAAITNFDRAWTLLR